MQKKKIILFGVILVLFVGIIAWVTGSLEKKTEKTEIVEKQKSFFSVFKKGKSSVVVKEEKEASKKLKEFFEAVKKGESVISYFYYYINPEEVSPSERELIEEDLRVIRRHNKERSEELKKFDKMKILKTTISGYGDIFVKTCDKEGFCQIYEIDLIREPGGQWKIRDVEKITGERIKKEFKNVIPEAEKVVKKFFKLVREKDYKEALKLFPSEDVNEAVKEASQRGIDLSQVFSEWVEKEEIFFLDEIEIIKEDVTKKVIFQVLFAKEGEFSQTYEFELIQKEGVWKIFYMAKKEKRW